VLSGRKPVLATWPEPDDEPDQTDPEPLDLWDGEDHSDEDLQRVREVTHSDM
jgi:hypothetical protein